MNTPSVGTILQDPNFKSLPLGEKNKVLLNVDPNFKALPPQEQMKALNVIHYGPEPKKPWTVRGVPVKRTLQEAALGAASGYTGLPESAHPLKDAAKATMTPPPITDVMFGPGVPLAKRAYAAGKEFLTGKDPETVAHGAGSLVGQGAAARTAVEAPKAAVEDRGIIPSTARAGRKFNEVMGAAHDIPVAAVDSGDTALRIKEFADRGATLPGVIRKFVNRMTDPKAGPLTYAEARDFYENATRLSADEMGKLQPQVKRLVGQFTGQLKQEIGDAAEVVNKRQAYEQAMSEYYRASQLKRAGQAAWKMTKKALPYAAAGAAAGLGYEAAKTLIP